jgi:hypothetical protein
MQIQSKLVKIILKTNQDLQNANQDLQNATETNLINDSPRRRRRRRRRRRTTKQMVDPRCTYVHAGNN